MNIKRGPISLYLDWTGGSPSLLGRGGGVECAIGGLPAVLVQAAVPEPQRWRGPGALRNGFVRAGSGNLASRKGVSERCGAEASGM